MTALDLPNLSRLELHLDDLLPQLADFADNQLLELAAHAQRLEACAFRLRGACVAELRRRITTRLVGGRGYRDADGIGIKAQLAQLASQIGISPTTLKTDARIHEVFFAGESRLAREPTLPREFYVTALGAPDPLATIRIAEEKAASKTYTREQFRRDVRALKHPKLITDNPIVSANHSPESRCDILIKISLDASIALAELTKRSGHSPDEIIIAALLAYHSSLTALAVAPQTSTITSPKHRRRSSVASSSAPAADASRGDAQPPLLLFE
jgi:hypothetical protein